MTILRGLTVLFILFVLQACDDRTASTEEPLGKSNMAECADGIPAINGECPQVEPLECGEGMTLVNGECMGEVKVCEDGSLPINGGCREDHPLCDADCEFTGDACICPIPSEE